MSKGPTKTINAGASQSDTRSKLLRAAREVVSELGYRRTRVADIVARAGISHGSFYNYFDDRLDVMAAVAEEVIQEIYVMSDVSIEIDASEQGATLEQVIAKRIGGFFKAYSHNWNAMKSCIEASASEPRIAITLAHIRDDYTARTIKLFKGLAARDVIQEVSPEIAARALIAMVEGFAFQRMSTGSRIGKREANQLAGMWMRSIYRPDRWSRTY